MGIKNPILSRRLLLLSLSAFVFSSILVGGLVWYGLREPKRGGNFILNYRSSSWSFVANAKKLNLVYVGYAKCPDVCPLSLSFAAQSFRQLSANDLKRIQLLFISVDTEHDTAASVADYAVQFHPDFVGLSGSKNQINLAITSIGASFMVEKDPKSYLGYSIAHSDRIFFLDKDGYILDTLPNPRSAEVLTQKIKDLL